MNITHIFNLLRAYFIENKTKLLICCLATFGVVTFGFTTSAMPEITPYFPYIMLFSLVAFGKSNLINNNSTHFNTLPATSFEKFIHAVFNILLLGIVLQFFSLAGAGTGRYLFLPLFRENINTFGYSFLDLNFLNLKGYTLFLVYLIIFLFGSIYFKKSAFIKTVGVGIGFLFGLGLYFIALTYLTLGNKMYKNIDNSFNINLAEFSFFQNYWYFFPIALIIFFLSLTYLRLRETEV
jgi:hypothetical protein